MKIIIDKINNVNSNDNNQDLRLAILDNNNLLQELYYNNSSNQKLKGRIYIGYVEKVIPSLQAAFVFYGNNKNGFLPLSEISLEYYNLPKEKKLQIIKDENDGNSAEQEKNENYELKYINNTNNKNLTFYKQYKIQDILKVGDLVLVQVTKEERGNKGVTLSTYINLSGIYLNIYPNYPKRSFLSSKITKTEEIEKLNNYIEKLALKDYESILLKSAAINRKFYEIKDEYIKLMKKWQELRQNFRNIKEKKDNISKQEIDDYLLHQEDNFLLDFIKNHNLDEYENIILNNEQLYEEIISLNDKNCTNLALEKKILLIPQKSIFTYFNIEAQIAELYQEKIYLKSGGYLIFHKTEALIAIDVNSGKMTCENNVESTAFKTNFEAVPEIVRHIKLRELSGIIIIDFIDMNQMDKRQEIEKLLNNEFITKDNAKIQISKISELGIVQLSRQRLRSNFQEIFTTKCNFCHGAGFIRNFHETSLAIFRAIEHDFYQNNVTEETICYVHIHHKLLEYLINNLINHIQILEQDLHLKIHLTIDEHLKMDMFYIEFGNAENPHKSTNTDNEERLLKSNNAQKIHKFNPQYKNCHKKNNLEGNNKISFFKKLLNKINFLK